MLLVTLEITQGASPAGEVIGSLRITRTEPTTHLARGKGTASYSVRYVDPDIKRTGEIEEFDRSLGPLELVRAAIEVLRQ